MRWLIRVLFETLVRLFFPSRTVIGLDRVPHDGPVIFVLNHPNGLLDPVLLRVALNRRVAFLGKSTLFGNPLGRIAMEAFDGIPVFRQQDVAKGGGDTSRNEETFSRCRDALSRGESLALFPEGVSHADSQLHPLKTGAARIALSAAAKDERARSVMIVPVGLAYGDRSVFRSSAVLVVGEPLAVRDHLDAYARDERPTVDALTDTIRARLDAVVLQAETREVLDGVARVAMWTSDDPAIREDPAAQQARGRELLGAYARLRERDPARVEAIVRDARNYARVLEALGVADPWDLEVGRVPLRAAIRVGSKLLFEAPFGIIGALLGWAPYRLAGIVAGRMVREEDVLGTVKLLAGTLFLLLAWIVEAVIVGLATHWWLGLVLFALAPACGYAALRFDETRELAVAALRHLWMRAWKPITVQRLANRRRDLAEAVAKALRDAA